MAATEPGTAVATKRKDELASFLERAAPQMNAVLPKHLTPERMFALVTLIATKTPKLLECLQSLPGKASFFNAIMHASRLGLEVGHRAHLVPFRNKAGHTECVMIPDYRGLMDLAINSGKVRSFDAECVFKGDFFEYEYGLNPKLAHRPSAGAARDDRKWGDIEAAYAIARLSEGGVKFVVLEKWELTKIKASSKASGDGPWVEWPERQCMKSAVKRVCNMLPQSPELSDAIELDNRAESGRIGRPLVAFDTPEIVAEDMREATEQRTADLKKRIVGAQGAPAADEPPPPDPQQAGNEGEQRRAAIEAEFDGLEVPEIHAKVKADLKKLGVEKLADINELVSSVCGLRSYQEIQSPGEAANVLYAAEARAKG